MIQSALDYTKKLNESLAFILKKIDSSSISVGIVLGTGLGELIREIDITCEIDYDLIPHFLTSTIETHKGKLIFGKIGTTEVVAMQGRFHFYEGYAIEDIVFPIRVMYLLGVKTLIASNACGGINPILRKGDIVVISDHINLLGDNPLIGENLDNFGERFPDMSEAYSIDLLTKAEKFAVELGLSLKRVVYVAVSGPNLETAAEYRFLRTIGADVVGMSTIPEVIVANHQGMKVLGLAVVTDECFPDTLEKVNISDIISVAMEAEPRLTQVMKKVITSLSI